MIKVSIIVPVYNVEDYLTKCLESLVKQTLEEIEIIVVNDGATDGSQKIIEQYSEKDSRIKAFTKENGGLSDARNFGMTYCTGEYVGFIDSDDFVEPDMFELLYQKAKSEDSDIVECNLRHTYDHTEDIEIGKEIYDKKELLMYGRSVVWNKIYKREWLSSTKVKFPKGLIYEDVQYFLMLIPHIRKYDYINEAAIHYVQRRSSINNSSTIRTMDILNILKNILCYYKEYNFYEEYEKALELFFARILLCSSFIRMTRILYGEERKNALTQNWNLLEASFPLWRQNPYLKKEKTVRALFMKTVNHITYRFYSVLFTFVFGIKGRITRS